MATLSYRKWQKDSMEKVQNEVKQKRTISPLDSSYLLLEGFENFQKRQMPTPLSGMSYSRIAGQALCTKDEASRAEIRNMLDNIRVGGAFHILGHGGGIKCGAVAAKKATAGMKREDIHEHETVLDLLERIPAGVADVATPESELINAVYQAGKVLNDPEFAKLIKEKNISVVVSVMDEKGEMEYHPLNRPGWTQDDVYLHHPKLLALKLQIRSAMESALKEGEDLSGHYAHAVFVYDPLDMRGVLDPSAGSGLEVGGFCCVDARSKPDTPDSAAYLFGQGPNRTFDITIDLDRNGMPVFSIGDRGSDNYRKKHVGGVNTGGHGEKGNGHTVTLATSMDKALNIRDGMMSLPDYSQEIVITVASFNGRTLRMENPAIGLSEVMEYRPEINICGSA